MVFEPTDARYRRVMTLRLRDFFDNTTLTRGRDYASRGLVVSLDALSDAVLEAWVSNGRGTTYQQRISLGDDWLDGRCSCPVGHNCKHVAAVMVTWAEKREVRPGLAAPVQGWLRRVKETAALGRSLTEARPEDYPTQVKDRLLYVLVPHGQQVRIDIFKGRINAAGTALNKSIRRYDAVHAVRSAAPAKFIRPVDLELLSALAQARLWEASYSYGLPDLLRPRGDVAIALVQRLCETGRFLHDNLPNAQLSWCDERPAAQLAWQMMTDGRQRLGFIDDAGRSLHLRGLQDATLWIDTEAGRIGALEAAVDSSTLELVSSSPDVPPNDAQAIAAALPKSLGGLDLPRPRAIRKTTREAQHRVVRLTLGRESARDGPGRYYGETLQLPTLTLRFAYDGQEVGPDDADPQVVQDGEVVTLARDRQWEAACATRLSEAGALPVEDLEFHWPSDRMMACDFVFGDGEMNPHTLEISDARAALGFSFRVVPALRSDGWEIIETPKWPYRLSEDTAELSVTTETASGDAFQGNDWFSLGFKAEIGGKAVDVAPLIAAFLEQVRADWGAVPDVEQLAQLLGDHPIYLDRGKAGYVALNLAPLAPLLYLFLTHHAELGALHPSDADAARLAEEALEGSNVRFSDNAGILPLARSLRALAETKDFVPPEGLTASLRDYQGYGAAWMGSLLEAGFGGVLADDMGLGKTVQTLALLQARLEAGAPGPALLIVPTSLLYGWQAQAAQFTPDLRLVVLHGTNRAVSREAATEADLVITTYPLLARDSEWLAKLNQAALPGEDLYRKLAAVFARHHPLDGFQ